MNDVLDCINIRPRYVDEAYSTIEDFFKYELFSLDRHIAEDVIMNLPNKCKEHFDWDNPMASIIDNMIACAIDIVHTHYPKAEVTISKKASDWRNNEYSHYSFDLSIDSETKKIAEDKFYEVYER